MPALLTPTRTSWADRARRLGILTLTLFLSIAFSWKLVLTDQYSWMQGPDFAHQVLPWFQFQANELHAGRLPLWDPHMWAGQSLIGQAQPGVAYPLNWILLLSPLRHGWIRASAMHWYFVLIHWMALVFAYRLCRDQGCSRPAALVGGLVFAFGGFVGFNDWPQMLNGAVWGPLVLLHLLRLHGSTPSVRDAWLAGAALGMSWLSGHHQAPIFLSIMTIGLLTTPLVRSRLRLRVVIRHFVLCFGICFLVAAVQLLPAFEYGRLAVRWVGGPTPAGWDDKVPYTVHAQYSLPPKSLLGIVVPGLEANASAYIGGLALCLAALGVLAMWHRPATAALLAIAAAGCLLAVGRFTGVHGVLYSIVPLVEKARSPGMGIVLFTLGVAPLAALGLDVLTSKSCPYWVRRIAQCAGLAGLALLLIGSGAIPSSSLSDERVPLAGLLLLVTAALLETQRRGALAASSATMLAVMLVYVELSVGSAYHFAHYTEDNRDLLKHLRQHSDVATFLRAQPGRPRVMYDDKVLQYNFGDWYGIDMLGGYLASMTANVQRLEIGSDRIERLFGAKYWVGNAPFRHMKVPVFNGVDGLTVFADPDTYPRAFAVRRVQLMRAQDIPTELSRPNLDLRETALSPVRIQGLETCEGGDTVELLGYQPDRVLLAANLPCARLVILSDSYFPGWHATVDAKSVPIHEVDSALRGVVVPAGHHLISMAYRPRSVYIGILLSLVGSLSTLVVIGRGLRFTRTTRLV